MRAMIATLSISLSVPNTIGIGPIKIAPPPFIEALEVLPLNIIKIIAKNAIANPINIKINPTLNSVSYIVLSYS